MNLGRNFFFVHFCGLNLHQLSKTDGKRPNLVGGLGGCVLDLLNLGNKKIVTYMSEGFLTF